ncbi:MAG: hypothetical protein EOO52_18505 [Gammaproteobacteria bacterium]|nr:MAG: hypothetical protein EOO52_18505 [Gammaproteobacteria bacterium]
MGENKTKTKAAMLNELESIKGLLLEQDDIPILQEVIENKTAPDAETKAQESPTTLAPAINSAPKATVEVKQVFEEQQDFFNSSASAGGQKNQQNDIGKELLETLGELEKHTAEVTADKFSLDTNKNTNRAGLAKATGENPFLPQHIRARLHGNNPPPLFETETARKISSSSIPSRQLGNTFSSAGANFSGEKPSSHQQDIIDSIVEKMMPEIEKELRNRLEIMTKNLLDELDK